MLFNDGSKEKQSLHVILNLYASGGPGTANGSASLSGDR